MSNETVDVVHITPELAQDWLALNTRNRTQSEDYVRRLTSAMQRGEFQFNGDGVRFSRSGVLLDGQHRLAAIVRSGVTVRQVVVQGLDDETQVTMDRQNRRTLGHYLQIQGEDQSKTLTAALNMAWQWDRGHRWKVGSGAAELPSYEQAFEYLQANPNIRTSVDVAKPLRPKKVMRESTGALLHWVYSRINPDHADDFMERLVSGAHVDNDDPVWALRERSKDLRADKLETPQTVVPIACKAWNIYRAGRRIKTLRVRTAGSNPEAFPEPK